MLHNKKVTINHLIVINAPIYRARGFWLFEKIPYKVKGKKNLAQTILKIALNATLFS